MADSIDKSDSRRLAAERSRRYRDKRAAALASETGLVFLPPRSKAPAVLGEYLHRCDIIPEANIWKPRAWTVLPALEDWIRRLQLENEQATEASIAASRPTRSLTFAEKAAWLTKRGLNNAPQNQILFAITEAGLLSAWFGAADRD